MDPPPQLSAESAAQLQQGINLLLPRWSALQMAVDNEWGGRDSRLRSHQLAVDIFSWLTQSISIDDLENMLDDFMLSLNTEIEDGSIEEIAEKLMIMHEECLEDNYNSIQILNETNPPPRVAVPQMRQGSSDDDDDDNDDETVGDDDSSEMAVDVPKSQSNPNHEDNVMVDEPRRPTNTAEAEDGWTVVAPRRNRGGRRN